MSSKLKVESSKLKAVLPGFLTLFLIPYSLFLLSSCGPDEDLATPKPYAYFRIDLPEKKYAVFSDSCPFEFEYPSNYALVLPDTQPNAEPCWKNIVYPRFRAELNLSYKAIDTAGRLEKYLDNSWELATKHQIKASGMPETLINFENEKVYGMMFEIEGNAASSVQFFVTDSTRHFLRGALYFYAHPNYDSLSPVITFLKKDIERMIATLKWHPLPPDQRLPAGQAGSQP